MARSLPVVADCQVCLGANEGYFYCLKAETGKILLIVPNSLAGENVGNFETPVLIAFSDEGQTTLNWTPTQIADTLEKTNLPWLLIFAGIVILVFSGYGFIKAKKKG